MSKPKQTKTVIKRVKKPHHFLAWFLGFLFGLFFPLISLVTAIFVVTPDMISPSTEDYLGDLSGYSFGGIVLQLVEKFSENGTGYTFGDLMEDYNIDPDRMTPDVGAIFKDEDIQNLPIGALANGGVDTFLEVAPASLIVGIASPYLGANADNVESALEGVSLSQLINFQDLENGTAKALEGVELAWILPFLTEGDNAIFDTIGQSTVGHLLAGFLSENIWAELKEDGHLSVLGSLTFVDLLGSIDQSMENILGDKAIADLVNEEDQLDVFGILHGLQIGTLLGYEKISDVWYTSSNQEVDGIEKILADVSMDDLLGGDFDVNVLFGDVYIGELLGYELNGEVWEDTDGNEVDSLMAVLADIQIGDLLGGDFDINNIFGDLYIGELLGYELDGEVWEDSDGNEVDTLMAVLADIQLGDLLGGDFDINNIFGDLYIGELLGYELDGEVWEDSDGDEVDSLMAVLADIQLGDLLGGDFDFNDILGDLYIGEIMGYERATQQQITANGGGNFCPDNCDSAHHSSNCPVDCQETHAHSFLWLKDAEKIEGITEFLANTKLADIMNGDFEIDDVLSDAYVGDLMGYSIGTDADHCDEDCDENHDHDYLWVDQDDNPIETISNVMANILIGDLLSGDFDFGSLLEDITLADVIEIDANSLLSSLAHCKISEIATEIENIYLGEMINLYRKEVAEGSPNAKLHNDKWYEGELACDLSHEHTDACLEFVWYTNESCTTPATGINEVLANLRVGDLNGDAIMDKVNTLTIADVLGYEERIDGWYKDSTKVEGIMATLAGTKIQDLSGKIDTLTLRDVLGDAVDNGILKTLADKPVSEIGDAVDGIYLGDVLNLYLNEVSEGTLNAKLQNGSWYEGKIACDLSHEHTDACLEFVWYVNESCTTPATGINEVLANLTIGELNGDVITEKVNTLTIADVLGYEERIDGWYNGETKLEGIMATLAGTKIKDLNSKIETITLRDVLGDDADTGILKTLADKPITELGDAVDGILLGDVLNLHLNEVAEETLNAKEQNDSWYEGKLVCELSHEHTDACLEFVWYVDEECNTQATGINDALANVSIGNLSGDVITEKVNGLTLRDVLGDENVQEGLLSNFADTKINELGDAFDDLYMGTVSGLYRKAVDVSTYTNVIDDKVKVKDGNYAKVSLDGTWYEAKLSCNTSELHSENCFEFVWYIDESCNTKATGINSAVANISLGSFDANTLSDVLESLTVKDFIDDGILTFDEEIQGKLSVLFCEHGGSATGYATYVISHYGATYKDYLDSIHTDDVAEYQEDLDAWQNLAIKDFINELIEKF